MSKFHIQLYNLLVNTSIFLAFTGACMAYSVSILLGYQTNVIFYLAIFLFYFSIYNINKKTDRKEDQINHPTRANLHNVFGNSIFLMSIFSLAVSLFLFLQAGWQSLLISLIPFIAVIFYSIPWIPRHFEKILRARRLKEITVLKNLLVSITVSSSMTFLQATYTGNAINEAVSCVFIIVFGMLFINTIVFDIRDRKGDKKEGIRTIPVVIGVYKTKILLIAFNTLLSTFIFAAVFLKILPLVACLIIINTLYTYVYILLFERICINYMCDVLVDGEYILLAVFLHLGRLIIR